MGHSSLFLKALNAPEFVFKYARTRFSIPNLQRKVECSALTKKYAEYLSDYNTFALLQWRKRDESWFDEEYYWKEFVGRIERIPSMNQPTLFLREKLNNEAMRICLESSLPNGINQYRCTFQNISEPGPIQTILDLTSADNAKLELHTLGLRTEGNNIAAYIQSFLEESDNMYKDISYEKLLSIAKQSKESENSSVRKLINDLAENGLSRPSIVKHNEWLVLTKA